MPDTDDPGEGIMPEDRSVAHELITNTLQWIYRPRRERQAIDVDRAKIEEKHNHIRPDGRHTR